MLSVLSDGREAIGRIVVGEFSETFPMDFSWWSPTEYRAHWSTALDRLEHAEHVESCLLSSMRNPETAGFLDCWPLYREGRDVFVRNSLIFLDRIDGEFDVERPWRHIEARSPVNEDGHTISEWRTTMDDVRAFRAGARL